MCFFANICQSELRLTETKLQATEEELKSLSLDRLRASANAYRELFSKVGRSYLPIFVPVIHHCFVRLNTA